MAVDERKPQPLPNLNDPVVDRNRRFTATWYRWLKPLLDTVVNTRLSLQATDALVTTNTAAITTEQSVRAAADGALATSISTLSTTVAGNTTSISTLTSAVDGIEAQWAVTINSNGRVTGLVRLDSGATGSTFSVLADKFIIVHPTVDGTTIQAFVTGLVDGVPTVGVNGNLLVDGTILARSLDVDTLSAITADIGTCTAGVIRSSDSKFVIDLNNKTISITT